ncbi:MAG: hypothetical protein GY716_19300 [bacterium]|nr:hypothetical protein [bacterium]
MPNGRSRRVWVGGCAAAIAIVLFVTLVLLKPAMPDRIVLLTGPEGSAYHDLGTRYAEDLRSRGLEADVLVTDGVRDNIQRLTSVENAVAFAPATAGSRSDTSPESDLETGHLVTFGSVGFEPLWLFHRSDLDVARIADLAGRTVITGGRDTVSDQVARRLIRSHGLVGDVVLEPRVRQTAESLVDGFLARTIDAAFVTGGPSSPVVKALLDANGVRFVSFDRAEAFAALIPGVTTLRAPEGVFDLARNVPPQDAHLLSTATGLVASKGIHPAVVPMLLVAAENVQQQTTVFVPTARFPSPDHVTLPLDAAARRYFSQGKTGLTKYLPYKVTRFLNHLGFMVLPILTVTVVLLKLLPTGLRIWGQLRLIGLLKRLEAVEKAHAAGADRAKLLAELDTLDRASATMFVPRPVVHDYIDFRQFLHDMRERVE